MWARQIWIQADISGQAPFFSCCHGAVQAVMGTFSYLSLVWDHKESHQWTALAKLLTLVLLGCCGVVQLLSRVWLVVTPRTAAHQLPCPSLAISRSLLKLMSIESVMPSSHLVLRHSLLLLLPSIFPSIRVFSNESALWFRWPKYSASVLPMNIQDWFPLELTGCCEVDPVLFLLMIKLDCVCV